MKKLFIKKAFTLIELIVAAALVMVVVLGIFAVNNVLVNNQQDYGQRYLVNSETQSTLNHILNNASLAVGSGANDNEAILVGTTATPTDPTGINDPNTFCIHQGPGSNILNNNNDIWLCYQFYPQADPNFPDQINYCVEKYNPVGDPRGASSCTAAIAAGNVVPIGVNNTTFLGSVNSIVSTYTTTPQVLFTVTLQNCLNNTAGTCNNPNPGVSSDPVNNPEVKITGTAFPTQVSS